MECFGTNFRKILLGGTSRPCRASSTPQKQHHAAAHIHEDRFQNRIRVVKNEKKQALMSCELNG
jgi:hypothetical protein